MENGRQVLIVDDDRDVVHAIRVRLMAAGFQTKIALSGQAGLDAASQCRPDVVVLDVRMPGMDGLTVLNWLKRTRQTRDVPVVMLSASLHDQQRALEAGARYFLPKPYLGATLVEAVMAAVNDACTVEVE